MFQFFIEPLTSVADPECFSRIGDPDLGIMIFFINPGSNNIKEEGEKLVLSHLFSSHKFHKIVNNFIFE
jgi:hypothetical protein